MALEWADFGDRSMLTGPELCGLVVNVWKSPIDGQWRSLEVLGPRPSLETIKIAAVHAVLERAVGQVEALKQLAGIAPIRTTLSSAGYEDVTLQEFRDAIEGVGRLAGEWEDKPQRLIWDLVAALEKQPLGNGLLIRQEWDEIHTALKIEKIIYGLGEEESIGDAVEQIIELIRRVIAENPVVVKAGESKHGTEEAES